MATVALSPLFNGYQGFLPNGLVNAGGLIYVYAAGTSTPATSYTSSAGTIANTNPIVLDSAGKPPSEIWLPIGSSYKLVITDSGNLNASTYDNIPALNDPTSLNALTATVNGIQTSLANYAPLNSPALTGTPTAPTPGSSDNSTTIATTAFVKTQLTTFSGFVSGTRKGLKVSANGTDRFISVAATELAVETSGNNYGTLRNVSVTIDITTTGVANGLDTGVPSANTWYNVFVIYNGTTAAGLISLSATAPTLPAGYTYFARVGSARTDGTAGKMLGYTQVNDRASYKVLAGTNLTAAPVIASGTSGTVGTTLTAFSISAFVPPTATRIIGAIYQWSPVNLTLAVQAGPNATATSYGGNGVFLMQSINTQYANQQVEFDFVLESTNIYYAGLTSGGGSVGAVALGWVDAL